MKEEPASEAEPAEENHARVIQGEAQPEKEKA